MKRLLFLVPLLTIYLSSCHRSGGNAQLPANVTLSKEVLLDKIKGGTTITPAAGYKFEQLAEPIVEQSATVPGKTNTYKYRIVAQ